MSFIYYLSVLLFIVAFIAIPVGLIRPSAFSKLFGKKAGRLRITLILVAIIFVLGGVLTATEPASVKTERLRKEQAKAEQAKAEKLKEEQPQEVKEKQLSSDNESSRKPTTKPKTTTRASYKVVKVVDGDTIDIMANGKKIRVRLIGIDTPEKNDKRKPVECFAYEASKKLNDLISNKRINLYNDRTQADKDKYNRLLRYVVLNGKNINKTMIEDGYAYEYTYNIPYKYQTEFKAAQQSAQAGSKGLWSTNTCNGQREKPKTQEATTAPVSTPSPSPTPTPAPTPSTSTTDVYYPNCTAARNAGAAPLYSGQPGYRPALDRDSDGVACE